MENSIKRLKNSSQEVSSYLSLGLNLEDHQTPNVRERLFSTFASAVPELRKSWILNKPDLTRFLEAWIKCRDPKGPNAPIVARALCRTSGEAEIQIVYNNRSWSDATANGKWYDVRMMHDPGRRAGKGEPDNWFLGNQREDLGYCMGKHCYDEAAIEPGSSGMETCLDS